LRKTLLVTAGLLFGLLCGGVFALLAVRGLSAAVASRVALEVRTALDDDSYNVPRAIQRRTTQATSAFVESHLKTVSHFDTRAEHLAFAVSKVDPKLLHDGLFAEFGVGGGYTINLIADHTKAKVHGFDSFEGLPESWAVLVRG